MKNIWNLMLTNRWCQYWPVTYSLSRQSSWSRSARYSGCARRMRGCVMSWLALNSVCSWVSNAVPHLVRKNHISSLSAISKHMRCLRYVVKPTTTCWSSCKYCSLYQAGCWNVTTMTTTVQQKFVGKIDWR